MSSVKKNIAWSLSSNVLPLFAGLILFPKIIAAYGMEQFGLLTLAWAFIGYFNLFDLGLSRALTQKVSDYISRDKSSAEIAQLIRTGFISMWILGIVGGVVLWICSPLILNHFLKISDSLQTDGLKAFGLLALSIPLVVHSAGLRAVLDALHLFKSTSIIKTILGVGTFLAPFLASLVSPTLSSAVISLIITRLITWLLYLYAVHHSKILIFKTNLFNLEQLKSLLKFSGWMTISNVISPIMEYMDRFMIASVLGIVATSYYVGPTEVIFKLFIIPGSIAGVLFPLFSKTWQKDPIHSAHLLRQGFLYTLLLLFPASALLVFFATEWLGMWLTPEFASQTRVVVCWLTIGVFINSAAQIVFAKVQGSGRSDWTAKLHLAEVLPYLAILYACLHWWGIAGAAIAWCIRVSVDLLGLLIFAKKINPSNLKGLYPALWMLVLLTALLIPSIFDTSLQIRLIEASLITPVYLLILIKELKADGILGKIGQRLRSKMSN